MTLSEIYCAEYLERIFYFALKKTGNEDDAGDLAGDISYEILRSLHRGIVPEHFSAESDAADIDAMADLLSDDGTTENALVLEEDLMLMRRELAFIR